MAKPALHYLDLLEAGRLIQSRELSSEELTQHMLDRIDNVDGKLGSYLTIMSEQAIRDAQTADREIAAGKSRGPLHGVPIAVKDLLWTAGVATTHGMPINQNYIPTEDATVIRRLREAGAVLMGKLKQTEGAFADHHPDIAPPINPWGASLWSGASSSGSGVATAAGLCFGAIGTDTGGSIRFPSAANGITGLKPTWGRVSRFGVFELAASLDHVGPMARSAADAAAMLSAIAGADINDPTASQEPVPDYLTLMTRGIEGLRVGIDPAWTLDRVDAPTKAVLQSVIGLIDTLGGSVREINFPDAEQALQDWVPLCAVETAVAHESTFPSRRNEYGPSLASIIDLGLELSATTYQKLWLARADFRGRVNALFRDVDLLLVPATAVAGASVELMSKFGEDAELFSGMLRYTSPFDLSGHPTITLPGGRTPGNAPVAFQFVAPHFGEALLARAGWAYQRVTDWHKRHPGL
ncbi:MULTISPECIES: amidase [Brenneria]|uniref:Amidase n=1 Tax=Brenneria nigrifluens DSM 30175 = ATCC 13028 TaxID=1121120 RepID=A0A2U1URH1_9GAMM|nr:MULTISPECIES: amidase [Brenneria]EHD22361.1 Amidase [Brenneria sp. EniD312]PWC24181.1 amidase [Brenneria nigrifluens] [Brenneria nigrifluens DSM 30175 = ATCC 13028]QCR05372.1 amidase [Brenneria nigrifluens] [Brenneria nigrifluens DSM 30175 = ATCC 13028]